MRNWQRIGAIILALFSVFFLFGCQETALTIKSVEINPTVELDDLDVSDFEYGDLSLLVTFSDDSTEVIIVTSSMISANDLAKLTYMGDHIIKITYEGFVVTLNLSLSDRLTLANLQTYYLHAVNRLGYIGTYEEWIILIKKGETGDIIKAEFNLEHDFIITLSNLQTIIVGKMQLLVYTVSFYDFYGTLITSIHVEEGDAATPPNAPEVSDYTFTGWDQTFDNVQSNLEVHAVYEFTGSTVSVENADELILSLTRLQEAQFSVNLDSIFSQTNSQQSVKRSRNVFDIYGTAVIHDTSDGFNPAEFIPHNYWNSFYYHPGLYQQPQVVDGYQVITSTLSSYSSHALNNLYLVNTQVTSHARERADWAVDYITVMDTWVDFGDYLYLLHYDETLDRVELYTIWTNDSYGVTSFEKIYVYYNQKGEEIVESWVEQIYEDTSTYPGVLGYHNSIAGRDFNYYAIWLDEDYQPTTQRHYRGINANSEGVYEYYDGSTSMISGEYGWYTIDPGIDDQRALLYYPDKPMITVYTPDASSDVFRIMPMFDGGYYVDVYLPSMRGVDALLVENGGMIQQNQDSIDTQNMLISQGFSPMPDWWIVDSSRSDLIKGFKTQKGTYLETPNETVGDVILKRFDIEIGSEGHRIYDTYFNYFATASLYVNANDIDELVVLLTAYFEEIGLTYKYGSTANLFLEFASIFENYETIGRNISIVNEISSLNNKTYSSYEAYLETHQFITAYLSIRETLVGMQSAFSVINQSEMPSKEDLNKITLIDTAKNISGSLSAVEKEISTEGITATLKRSPLLQQGKSYTLYYALQVGGRLIVIGQETPQIFSGQDLTFTGNQSFVIPEDLTVGHYELVVFFGKEVLDAYLRISNPLALPITGLNPYHVITPDDDFEMATDTYVYTAEDKLKVNVENIDLYPPKITFGIDGEIYQGEVTINEWMMPLGSTVYDLLKMLRIIDNFDGLIDSKVSMIQKDGSSLNLSDVLTETGWTISVTDTASNTTKITFTKISFGYTVTWILDEEVIEKMIVKPGETITPLNLPERVGYTITGWDTEDFTINENRIIHALYTINTYSITWMYDGQVVQIDHGILYGTGITTPGMPNVEGYYFRWNLDSTVMPGMDLIVTGSYVFHEYYVTYYIDGIYYGSQAYHVGDTIVYLVPNTPDGMVFSGWNISDEIMPAAHLDAYGTFITPEPA